MIFEGIGNDERKDQQQHDRPLDEHENGKLSRRFTPLIDVVDDASKPIESFDAKGNVHVDRRNGEEKSSDVTKSIDERRTSQMSDQSERTVEEKGEVRRSDG